MESKTLNSLYSDLVSRAYEEDYDVQREYLSVIEDQRKIPVEYLMYRGALFIPNNEYIRYFLKSDADNYSCDFYRNDNCQWTLFITFPIQDLSAETVGLVGWDVQNKYLELTGQAQGLPMYKVSPKSVFAREKYFLSDVSLLQRTFDSRVIFITDGVFDSISLNFREIPAISLLGSTFSREILYFLQWYKTIYVVSDNDPAGQVLYKRMKRILPNVHQIKQNKTKDIEELLRTDSGVITKQLVSLVKNPVPDDIIIK